jgi:hypothetical protein
VRLYAETNFILEGVFEQQDLPHVEALVAMATSGEIELVLPSASLFEAYGTVHRRRAERIALVKRLDDEMAQIGRSLSMANEASQVRAALGGATALVTSRFRVVREHLLVAARWISLDGTILSDACSVEEQHGLETPDAIVFASIFSDASQRSGASVFVTKNSSDFDDPGVTDAMLKVGCEVVFTMDAALQRMRARR